MFHLPDRPDQLAEASVAAWSAPVVLPTFAPEAPDRYPAYLDRRVYQGSSGRVYPLPFHDRISEEPTLHSWQGLHLENDYLRVLVLPELGGRIQYALDKRTGYPIFYANPVIKPALVGLAGPWLAGGVEFNWPQHHRPATYLPTAWSIEEAADEVTVWLSDHDPFQRMKGMHGVRLSADSTVIEVAVRLFNRSEQPQTFLWWANVAALVHSDYQSFFPDDVHAVADHAKRAVTSFPTASGPYYGVDYPARRDLDTRDDSPLRVPGDRLDWYRNIPVPTSYMCLGSSQDFFGGYDHRAGAGFVHWADHHYAVGKKQWSWGDSPFGHAWNRNLAEDDADYIELMAGVFTDNQPDFSHLAPGETKTFSQYWYPVAGTGPVVAATLDAALGVSVQDSFTQLTLDTTQHVSEATLVIRAEQSNSVLRELSTDLDPQHPLDVRVDSTERLTVELGSAGRVLLRWTSPPVARDHEPTPAPAAAPDPPPEVTSVEELYLAGQHLEQYRHATRSPEPYWDEALRRDPGHAPTHIALALRRYREARYGDAEGHLATAVDRLTRLNPNPSEGAAHYLLGLTLVRLGREVEAYAAFAKSTWLREWVAPGSHQMALIDARAGRDKAGLIRTKTALQADPEHLQVRNLQAVLLRRLDQDHAANQLLATTLHLDPLDAWARDLTSRTDEVGGLDETQTLIDVGVEYARCGEFSAAARLFGQARERDADRPLGQTAGALVANYHEASALDRLGDPTAASAARERARAGDRLWNFPSRLDDVEALGAALLADPGDATAAALLGHWHYAHSRPERAIALWRQSLAQDPGDPVVRRNLAIAAYDQLDDPEQAMEHYREALRLAPDDARLWYESDQLLKRIGTSPVDRLQRLEAVPDRIGERDDLSTEYAHLLVTADRPSEALDVLQSRRFQPWEGGEGQVLRAWERTQLSLCDQALGACDPHTALEHARAALKLPANLGEERHPLANPAELLLALGEAAEAVGDDSLARTSWRQAADAVGDFNEMAPMDYSENTFFSVLAARRLGDHSHADTLVGGLSEFVEQLAGTRAGIDYFATSLPTLLLFDDDPQRDQDRVVRLLRAQLAFLADDEAIAHEQLAPLAETEAGHDLTRRLQSRNVQGSPR